MPLVVTAPGGMLGKAFVQRLGPECAVLNGRFDITEAADVARAIRHGTTHVINTAAYTAVDDAEREPDAALRVNALGPRVLAERCREIDATLVHFSTDYIFSGDDDGPIPVAAQARPLNAYGLSKLAGERAIAAVGGRSLVVRTSWLFAAHGTNFVRTILRLARERDRLEVVDDQHGRPTSCAELVRLTLALLDAGASGTFHACNDGCASWCDLARAVVDIAGGRCAVVPCSSERFPRPARRPRYSVLDLSKTVAVTGPAQTWQSAVLETVGDLA